MAGICKDGTRRLGSDAFSAGHEVLALQEGAAMAMADCYAQARPVVALTGDGSARPSGPRRMIGSASSSPSPTTALPDLEQR